MRDLVAALSAQVAGPVRRGEALAAYTTLRVGGPAAALVRAESVADLAAVARVCERQQRPWLVLGRGSNLLVADSGWPGVVVTLGRGFRGVTIVGESGRDVVVEAGAAEPMPVLATTVAGLGLAGLAFGIAIPGTLGGAVRMNAGAHGSEMRDVLRDVDVVRLGEAGRQERLAAAELEMGYRHTSLPPDAVVTAARLVLRRADTAALRDEMAEMRRWRRAHQPINAPSCGSVFRNPPGDSAGRLVEEAGLKGERVGGARVSPVHANFITVEPGARAADVHDLIRSVQRQVAERTGVRLQTEVVVVGFEDAVSVGGG